AAGVEDRLKQTEALQRRHCRGLDEVRADTLESVRVGALLYQGDAGAGAAERDRRRAAGEAGADNDGVVVRCVGDAAVGWLFRHPGPPGSVLSEPFVPYYTARTMKSKPIRLTTPSYALLALLEQLGESTPYEIKGAMEQSLE